MPANRVEDVSTTGGLPIAPSMTPDLVAQVHAPRERAALDRRVVYISALALGLGGLAALVAQTLGALIALITNLSFFHQVSLESRMPADAALGWWVIGVPVVGGLVVGLMARYGSQAIRGHGIPEAMEKVLLDESRIPARMTFLKPLSSAVAIGTGGPFGAEGPIIATGSALGSLIGQKVRVTAQERKALLAAGAAAGMAATFGSPVSAVVLAVELLLFEYRPRSVIPVALAATVATALRWTFEGTHPVFAMPDVVAPGFAAMVLYVAVGAVMGLASVFVTRAVYGIEDAFEKLPVHWMWWPALGGLVVGVVGLFSPRTLGVGYQNIGDILSGQWAGGALAVFIVMKFISWSLALGSGTSGGTLAPLFTLGGGTGFLLGLGAQQLFPAAAVDPRVAALVGMAALFAGASRALLASTIFAFEVTLQPLGLLPLLGGCSAAYLVSALMMRHSIMTEKLARRGTRVPEEYAADYLDRELVRSHASRELVSLRAEQTVGEVRRWLAERGPGHTHQGFPVLDGAGHALGVVTRRDLLDPAQPEEARLAQLVRRPPVVVFADQSLRDAADHMVEHRVGRLLVVERAEPRRPVGILTRSDVLHAHATRLAAEGRVAPGGGGERAAQG